MRTRVALAVLAAALVALLPAAARASTTIDIRGTWTITVNGSSQYTETFAKEDMASGSMSGSGSGNGYTWTLSGSLNGSQLVYTAGPYAGGYTSTVTATVAADGGSYTGTFKDSNNTTGTVNGVRTALLPPGGGGGPGPGGNPAPPGFFKTVCVSIWIGDCTGFLPPPDPLQVCVSAWQDCNGFGGSKRAKPGTIDMSGFPSELKTPVACEQAPAPRKSARVSRQDRSISDNPDLRCKLDIYLNDTSKTRGPLDDEFQYDQNLRLFQAEVDLRKGKLVSSLLRVIGQLKPPDQQAPARFFITAGAVWQAAIEQVYENAKERGKPVDSAVPAKNDACFSLAEPSVCLELVDMLNKSTAIDLADLSDLKHSLGVDVPFQRAKVKGSSWAGGAAASRRRTRIRRVLAFGSVSLAEGRHATLRMKIPKRVRQMLRHKRQTGHRVMRVKLTIDAELGPGLRTTRTRTVKLLLVKRG
jgi:hypothetical protein